MISQKMGKDITLDAFLYGDFDGDSVINIDDSMPYNPDISESSHPDLRLSSELLMFRTYAAQQNPLTKVFEDVVRSQVNGTVSHRVKNEVSMINKLRKKYLNNITDIAGMRILAPNKIELDKNVEIVNRIMVGLTEKQVIKDYYSKPNPENPCYRGHHTIVYYQNAPVEIQHQTERVHAITEAYHGLYKHQPSSDSITTDTFCRLINIASRADNGEIKAQNDFKTIMPITKNMFESPPDKVSKYPRIDKSKSKSGII